MRRFYFAFTFSTGADATETLAFTTNEEHADEIRRPLKFGASAAYLTPPLTRVEYPDSETLRRDMDERVYRANLARVVELEYWTEDL